MTSNQMRTDYPSSAPTTSDAWAMGAILFAAVMMMMSGAFQAMTGLVALFENEFYVTTPNYFSSSTRPPGDGSTC